MFDKIRKVFFAAAGSLSLAYYVLCALWAYPGVSWLWIWPLFSAFCALRFFMLKKQVKLPKWLRTMYYLLLAVAFAVFAAVEAKIIHAMHTEPTPELDYIITLGAAVRDGEPTSPLRLRCEMAAEYLKENPDTVLIASGGQGPAESMSEAECIRRLVTAAGISEERILLEDESTSTEENIRNSFRMIPEGTSVGVVSSSFHIYRAVRIAELQGHTVSGIPARALYPFKIHYTVREFFGVVQLEVLNLLK